MQPEDLHPFLFGGKIDEEYFIEAALPHEFRRQLLDIIGCGDDENGGFLFLHPCDQTAEHTGLGAAIPLHAADAGKALSTSSIHKTQGAMASAIWIISLVLASDSPT